MQMSPGAWGPCASPGLPTRPQTCSAHGARIFKCVQLHIFAPLDVCAPGRIPGQKPKESRRPMSHKPALQGTWHPRGVSRPSRQDMTLAQNRHAGCGPHAAGRGASRHPAGRAACCALRRSDLAGGGIRPGRLLRIKRRGLARRGRDPPPMEQAAQGPRQGGKAMSAGALPACPCAPRRTGTARARRRGRAGGRDTRRRATAGRAAPNV